MFTVPYSKIFSPWTLGQSRTLGRALDLDGTRRTLREWEQGIFGQDLVAEAIVKDLLQKRYTVSDKWGPEVLYDAWTGRLRLTQNRTAPRTLEIAKRVLLLQVEALPAIGRNTSQARAIVDQVNADVRLTTLMALSYHFRRAIEVSFPARCVKKLQKSKNLLSDVLKRFSSYKIPGTQLVFYFTAGPVIVHYGGMVYLSSHDHLLCYSGKIDTLCSYTMFLPWAGRTYLTLADERLLNSLVAFLHATHVRYDQKFFECAKLLDGLAQAFFLMTPEVDGPVNRLMLDQIIADAAGDKVLAEFVDEAGKILKGMSAAALIEASSFGKCSGHPSVNVESGLEQLKERANDDRQVNKEAVLDSVRALKKQYCINQILKNRSWPALLPGASKSIALLASNDALPDGPQAAALNIILQDSDWDSVDFAATKSLQLLTSLVPYIRDKTISLDRNDTFSTYLTAGLEVLHTPKHPLTSHETYQRTALVLYVLLTSGLSEDFKSFLDKLVRAPNHDLSDILTYLIIKVVPKEGELKTKARLFGEKTFNYRLHSMLQELTAAQFLSETFPRDQAMTCGELELKKRLYALTTLQPPSPDYDYVHLVTDVSGWNNGFRQESVGPIGKVLDQIHGTTIFEKTQLLYRNSVIVHQGPAGIRGWEGQEGGIEGLNQDTWVIVYLSQMHAIFSKLQYRYYFMDMGDNFIVKLSVPKRELEECGGPAQFAMKLSQRLSVKIRLYGHDAKPDESTCSHSAFIFCHQYRVRGIQIPAHFRKAAKLSGINDAFFPLLDNYVGCAYSNAHATAEQGSLTMASYHCAVIWSCLHMMSSAWSISGRGRRHRYRDLEDDQLVALLLTPNLLGGFPIIYLETMYLRSEADHLPQCIRLYEFLKTRDRSVAATLRRVIYQPRDTEASLLTLLTDPRALALTKPVGAAGILNAELDGRLSRVAQNEELVQLYEVYDETALETLIRCLQHNTTWPARLLAALYGSSGFAARQAVLACFESSRTAISFLLHTRPYRASTPVICRRALAADQRLNRWRRQLLDDELGMFRMTLHNCPALAAQQLRKYHWRREITTITTPPMGHLFELLEGQLVRHGVSFIQLRVDSPRDRVGTQSDHLVQGPYEPFLGHTTSSATRNQLEILRAKDVLFECVMNLSLVRSWSKLVDDDGSLCNLVDDLLASFTTVPYERLLIISGERSHGTIEHHLRGRGFNPTIAPNTQTSLLSLVTYDTRQAEAFQRGKKYAVNFLEEVLFAQYMLLGELQTGRTCTRFRTNWVLKLTPCECFQPLETPPITVGNTPGRRALRGAILPPPSKAALTELLEGAIMNSGSIGVFSTEEPKPSQAAIGLLLGYWAQLSHCIETVGLRETSDAQSWRHLAYMQGHRLPKEISINVLRRVPPQILAHLMTMMNTCNVITESRRAAQIAPSTESCHTPGTTALIHLTRIASEGALLGPLYDAFEEPPTTLQSNVPPIYHIIWSRLIGSTQSLPYKQVWLSGDIDYHSFIRVIRLLLCPLLMSFDFHEGTVDHPWLKTRFRTYESSGKIVCRARIWLTHFGLDAPNAIGSLIVYRTGPTVMHDLARTGRSYYPQPAPLVPIGTPIEWIRLECFNHSLQFRASLRPIEEPGGSLTTPTLLTSCLHVWRSTTRSPSRLIYLFDQIGLNIPNRCIIACLGDGLGGNSHFLSCLNLDLTIFYSTLFRSTMEEQAPMALRGVRGRISDEYMSRNLRDVTKKIWLPAFGEYPHLNPNIIISDAEIASEEQLLLEAESLGEVVSVNPSVLIIMRMKKCTDTTIGRVAARLNQFMSQVTYASVPSRVRDGFIIGRYGWVIDRPLFVTQESMDLLNMGCEITNQPTVIRCLRWCINRGAVEFPLLSLIKNLGVTARHMEDAPLAHDLVTTEIHRNLNRLGALDLSNAKRLVPILMALAPQNDELSRYEPLLGDSFSKFKLEGLEVKEILRGFVHFGLLPHDDDIAAADEEFLDDLE